jgi:hypothetical protein
MSDPGSNTEAAQSETAPPASGWIGTAGFVIACVLGLVKLGEAVSARHDRARNSRKELDQAWFRTIALEGAIPDLRRFLEAQRSALRDAAAAPPAVARPYLAALMRYAPASEELKIRLQPLEELSTHAHATIIRALEDLDDRVAPLCPHGDDRSYNPDLLEVEGTEVQLQFARCLRDCLIVLQQVHVELSRGRNPDRTIPMPQPP